MNAKAQKLEHKHVVNEVSAGEVVVAELQGAEAWGEGFEGEDEVVQGELVGLWDLVEDHVLAYVVLN